MPPEVSPCQPIVTPLIQLLPQEPPRYRGTKRMIITRKKLIPILVFALSSLSILRLLKIFAIPSFSSPPTAAFPPTRLTSCSSPTPVCKKIQSQKQDLSKSSQPVYSASATAATCLTEKEYQLLSNIISVRAPCNLLIFGLEPQYLNLSSINAGGTTVFLEDNQAAQGCEAKPGLCIAIALSITQKIELPPSFDKVTKGGVQA